MNKTIRDLAHKANFNDNDIEDMPGLETFAELIVKECRNIYNLIDNGNPVHGTEDYPKALFIEFLSGK